MPSFLNPLILLGLAAALIPLLIHLLSRRRLKTVEFSSIWFLKHLEKSKIRQLKLKNLLLLLLRILAVILIVLAFARPALKGELSGLGKAAAVSVVIILDDSYPAARETARGSWFELAQKKAITVLEHLSPADQACLIFSSSPPDSAAFTRGFAALKEEIASHRAGYLKLRLNRALEQAGKLLNRSSNLNREIYILTDNPGTDFESWKNIPPQSTVYRLKVSEEKSENLAVTRVDLGRQLIELDQPFTVNAEISNFSSRPVKEKLVGIYLDGNKVAQTEIAIPPQSQTQVEFTYSVGNTGFHSGYIELGEDNLLSDNYRYFGFKIPEEIRILVAGESAGDNLPLQLALKPDERLNLNLEVRSILESGLTTENFDSYDVVILNNLNSLAPITISRLGHYLETGGGAWIILGPDSDLDSYSQNLTVNRFGLTLSRESKAADVGAHHFLENWDFNHPVFSIYKEISKDSLPKVQFSRIVPAQAKSGSGILAGFSGNLPALIETKVETGKALLFLSDLESSSSDLSLHPFFVPLVNRIVGYLASDLEAQNRAFSTGDVIQLQLEQLPAGKPIQLIHPDQTKEALTPILTGNSALVRIDKSFLPGAYRIESEGKLLEQAIFNIDTHDSDLRDISLNQIREQFKSSGNQINLVEVPASAGLAEFVQRTRYGRELWREVLVLALLLLGAEMWLGRTVSRTESDQNIAAKASA